MKQSTYKMLVIVLTMVILLGGSVLLYQNLGGRVTPQQAAQSSGKTPAPDFVVTDQSDGTQTLSELLGKPVVLNFWSSRCQPCREEMPLFQQAYDACGDRVEFLMINLTDSFNDTIRSAMEFVTENGYTFPVYFDTQSSAAAAYQITGMPVTYFIDADGSVYSFKMGMISAEELEAGLQAIAAD